MGSVFKQEFKFIIQASGLLLLFQLVNFIDQLMVFIVGPCLSPYNLIFPFVSRQLCLNIDF